MYYLFNWKLGEVRSPELAVVLV